MATDAAPTRAPEQMRAREPDQTGFAERDGVRIFYEVYGAGEPTLVLVPTWRIIHGRFWKAQIPYFARHGRVVTFDPRGNGRSDRPATPEAYSEREMAADILSVMDATDTARAVLVTLSLGAQRGLIVAGEHPGRVLALVALGPTLPIGPPSTEEGFSFTDVLETEEGWAKHNVHYWRRDFDGYLRFFFSQCFSEPHSTKQIEDCVGWGHEIGAETLALGHGVGWLTPRETLRLCRRVRCPTLVVVGDEDRITEPGRGIALAAAVAGAELVVVAGGGHIANARHPVRTNLLIRDFIRRFTPGFGEGVG